jgi:tryptophan synthase alpha chain
VNRISNTFTNLKKADRKALVTFVMGGDPSVAATNEILHALVKNGADVIEIGMPFSDPMADGKSIQAAGIRALEAGTKLSDIFNIVADFRKTNTNTPVVLMGYVNPLFHMGMAVFCKHAAEAGVDGLIIVDMPPEEEAELTVHTKANQLDFIRLIAPTSQGDRLKQLAESSSGFIYYVSVAGTTGGKSADASAIAPHLAVLRTHTDLPICLGFGIKTSEHVRAMVPLADGLVVGSALVEVIAANQGSEAKAAGEFVASLASTLK